MLNSFPAVRKVLLRAFVAGNSECVEALAAVTGYKEEMAVCLCRPQGSHDGGIGICMRIDKLSRRDMI